MIKVSVPATSANCAVGFDCLGMALDWWAHFTFNPSQHLEISGCQPEFQNGENLVVKAFYYTCDVLKKEHPTFSLDIDAEIPFQRGLGTSALCIVAGVLAADRWFECGLNKMEVLRIATELEGHPDNVAPAIFGNAVVSYMEQGQPRMMLIPCANWNAMAVIPDVHVSTEKARENLPDSIAFNEVTLQVAHALAFSQALQIGNELVLFSSCKDVLHQPYRKHLIPQFDSLEAYCQENQIPMWISGSGSTMICMSMDIMKLQEAQFWVQENLGCKTQPISIAKKGAFVEYE